MTMAVRDPVESANFCVKHLDCTEIEVPDPALVARGIKWVRLPGENHSYSPSGELHFIPCNADRDIGMLGACDKNNDGKFSSDEIGMLNAEWWMKLQDDADEGMSVWTVFANTHCAWYVADLTNIVLKLKAAKVPFFGPTLRGDGVVQLYVEIPFLHYVEIDSNVYDATKTGLPPRPWSEVAPPKTPGS